MLKKTISLYQFVGVMSLLTALLFHFPFFEYVFTHLESIGWSGILLIISLFVAMLLANFFVFLLFMRISKYLGKALLVLFFIINALSVYFVNTYSVIVDESMIGNVLNTNYEESSGFFSIKMLVYFFLLGVLPSVYIMRSQIVYPSFIHTLKRMGLLILVLAGLVFANASNWLWIDKNSKQLGGLAMPWSYSVNTILYYVHQSKANEKEILLPNAHFINQEKSIVVLVIGESARKQNFSLYGYPKNTNPLLSKIPNLGVFNAQSCATYTTAGVKCILEHTNSSDLYEILPNYLYRNQVEVIWRSTNWGEPPVHIKNYIGKDQLLQQYPNIGDYDEILLAGLKEQILQSKKNKIFVVLHTSTSHGPNYNKKYPKNFQKFSPICNSVELANCSQQQLINSYDNTIVYTDYLLHQLIQNLKEIKDYKSSMIFVSDHGESLGEKNLYMHGLPMSIAPKEQYEIPFLVWSSNNTKLINKNTSLSQNYVFHSVMNFLGMQSPIYNPKMNVFVGNQLK